LTADLVIRRNRVPVTTPARTAADLRKAIPAWERRGLGVRRFTHRQVCEEPAHVAADLRDALAPAS
jgi:hypothetical protein